MDKRALEKSASRLRLVRKSLLDLDASVSFEEFSDTWYSFLTAWKNIYTILEQGSKTTAQSRQWFGAKKRERKSDPLLQYLFEARNDDEHGLDNSLNLQPRFLDIGVVSEGSSRKIRLDGGPFSNVVIEGGATAARFEGSIPKGIRATSLDGKPIKISYSGEKITLTTVKPRGRPPLGPPTEHLGLHLSDSSPLNVAKQAADYINGLHDEASNLV